MLCWILMKHSSTITAALTASGFEFTDTLDTYFNKISRLPTASAIRYDNVRVKPIDTFPYTIHFTIEEDNSVLILRVFNTYQEPLY
jgi:hypothetical protein